MQLKENFTYEETLVQIIDHKEQVLRCKVIPLVNVTPAGSRSDPVGGSEPKSGARYYLYYIMYTETFIDLFFLRAGTCTCRIQTISVITKIIYIYTKELPPEWYP